MNHRSKNLFKITLGGGGGMGGWAGTGHHVVQSPDFVAEGNPGGEVICSGLDRWRGLFPQSPLGMQRFLLSHSHLGSHLDI